VSYTISQLEKHYGSTPVLAGIDLAIPESAITVVLGPSGCGKTTLLNILAGLDHDYAGSIDGFADGRASYVFQEDRLLPWISARDNIAFVLRPSIEASQAQHLSWQALSSVGLDDQADSMPPAMSGGQRRRVALARAFAYPSDFLLLDEPFSSLDLKTRIAVMDLFVKIRAKDGRSAVVVTHDVREAIYLADRIAVLSERPARVLDVVDLSLDRSQRSYTSSAAVDLETRLYRSILS